MIALPPSPPLRKRPKRRLPPRNGSHIARDGDHQEVSPRTHPHDRAAKTSG